MDEQKTSAQEQDYPETGELYESSQKPSWGTTPVTRPLARSAYRPNRRWRDAGIFFLLLVFGVATLLTLVHLDPQFADTGKPLLTQPIQAVRRSASPQTAIPSPPVSSRSAPLFHEYAFPRPNSQVMRLALDHQGRLWFGAMDQNTLVMFDPRTHIF